MKNRARRPRGYWTKETVFQGIKERKEAGLSLRAEAVYHDDSSLYTNARKYYGGWYRALETVGEDVGNKRNKKKREGNGYWTAEQVLVAIKELAESGNSLRMGHIKTTHGSLLSQTSIHYGGWYAALEACGIDISEHKRNREDGYWSEEVVIARIQERAAKNLSLVTGDVGKDDKNLRAMGARYFGTWVNALTASGFDAKDYLNENSRGYWTEERVREELWKRKDSGQSMRTGYIKSENRTLYNQALVLFGSYKEAIEKCGLAVKK